MGPFERRLNDGGSNVPELSDDDWRTLSEHLDEGLKVPDAERAAWLDALRERTPVLADRVAGALGAGERPGYAEFLAGSAPLPSGDPATTTLVGRPVGAYVIEAEIGRGGMGSVWRARRADGRFEGQVAIKFVHLSWLGTDGEQRFLLEGKALGRLDHPNIARLLDAGVLDGTQPFLVLEHVEGVPIDQYCNDLQLSVEGRIRLFLDVLAAVSHAHSHLIVHRDLKPSNVLVTSNGAAKLLDFGIAKLLQDDGQVPSPTRSSAQALTPQYAAPEQLLGRSVTTATDAYALGVILYELLAGQRPFGTAVVSPAELVRRTLHETPPRASHAATVVPSRRRSLEGDVDNILGKALKTDPTERYAGAAAMADDLERFLTHQPITARPDTLGYRSSKFVRRHRGSVLSAALTALALVATTGFALRQTRLAEQQRAFAYRQLDRAESINDLNSFLLSDAAPSGAPFTALELLKRAEAIVARQRSGEASRVQLLISIGRQYATQDEDEGARRVLEKAYSASRALRDPSILATASCALAAIVSQGDDPKRAAALLHEGLAELPAEPQFAFDRAFCELRGSEVARAAGDARNGIAHVLAARDALQHAPFQSAVLEMRTQIDLAEAYREAGQLQHAVAVAEQAERQLVALGRDATDTAGTFYNNLALSFLQLGRPLDAERLFRRAIDISRIGASDQGVSPQLAVNYAKTLDALGRVAEAAGWADRAYEKARQADQRVAVHQALLARGWIYVEQRELVRAQQMLDEVEPLMRAALPPGHYGFGSLASERSVLAAARGNFADALKAADVAVELTETAAALGAGGAVLTLPVQLDRRAAVNLDAGRPDAAEADARRAIALFSVDRQPGTYSFWLGHAYLDLGRALTAQGQTSRASEAFRSAASHLEPTLGSDHPDAQAAKRLALSAN